MIADEKIRDVVALRARVYEELDRENTGIHPEVQNAATDAITAALIQSEWLECIASNLMFLKTE